ncbi:MAG: G-D-S-L family lipolytic protein [Ruminococcaceae bacterium]|nr:G-D-S-L family lipolytic protein [Oscillospiraceae bacterium]
MKERELLKSPGIMGGDGTAADALRGEYDLKNMQIFCNEAEVDICFFGDSITYLMEPSVYYKKFGNCINRGICGDSVHIMNKRFEADVLQLKPRVCVMMGGINNTWCLDETVDENGNPSEERLNTELDVVKNSYIDILERAKEQGQRMILCSVMPVTRQIAYADMRNKVVLKINAIIKELCERYNVPYVDYHSAIVCSDGLTLRDGLSDDGLHPHYKGYIEMAKVLTPVLEEFFK